MKVSGLDAASLQLTTVEGEVVRIAPLSFWGGVDSSNGRIIDPHHPDCGLSLAGKIVVMARTRGSSSSSSVLAECIRRGSAPATMVLEEADPIILIGALVAEALYGLHMPVLIVER